jgi:hypothetical protein
MKYCPRCSRTEDQRATCPDADFKGMECPPFVSEDPTTTVTLSCGPCEFTRIVPVKDLVSGAARKKLPVCRRDECACKVIPYPVADPVMPEVKAMADKEAEAAREETPAGDDPLLPEVGNEPAGTVEETLPEATVSPAPTALEAPSKKTAPTKPAKK